MQPENPELKKHSIMYKDISSFNTSLKIPTASKVSIII